MNTNDDLMKRICECLAFHAAETELTFKFMSPQVDETALTIADAKSLITEAGFDFDTIYPLANRPKVVHSDLVSAFVEGALGFGS